MWTNRTIVHVNVEIDVTTVILKMNWELVYSVVRYCIPSCRITIVSTRVYTRVIKDQRISAWCCCGRKRNQKCGIAIAYGMLKYETWINVPISLGVKIKEKITNNKHYLLLEQVTPKYSDVHAQMKVSTLTSMHVAPLLHGELWHATQGSKRTQWSNVLITKCQENVRE